MYVLPVFVSFHEADDMCASFWAGLPGKTVKIRCKRALVRSVNEMYLDILQGADFHHRALSRCKPYSLILTLRIFRGGLRM